MRRYWEEDKISNQQKIEYEKNRDKILFKRQNNRCIQIKDLIISYVQLANRLKKKEKNLKNITINDSEIS